MVTEILYKIYDDDRFLSFDHTYSYAIQEAKTMGLIENRSGKLYLTEKGLRLVKANKSFDDYLEEEKPSHTTIHIKDANNTIIGSGNTQSSSFNMKDATKQTSTPTAAPRRKLNTIQKFMRGVFIALIASLIFAALNHFLFHWV